MKRMTAWSNGNAYYPKCFESPCDGICRAKKKSAEPTDIWYVGEVITSKNNTYLIMQDSVAVMIDGEGTITNKVVEVAPETVQRYTGLTDARGKRLFEGDVIGTTTNQTVRMEICYGKYGAFCPNDQEYMQSIGFFVVSNMTDYAMPLGKTDEYAHLLGNIVDNPDLDLGKKVQYEQEK